MDSLPSDRRRHRTVDASGPRGARRYARRAAVTWRELAWALRLAQREVHARDEVRPDPQCTVRMHRFAARLPADVLGGVDCGRNRRVGEL